MREAARTIVVATDGSAASRAAVELAIELAQALGTTLAFVSVRKPPYPVRAEPHSQPVVSKGLQLATKAVAEAVALAKQRGIASDGEVVEGIPAPEIIAFARARSAELIVIGSRGLGAVKGIVLGGVSSAVVHHADRPVVVVRKHGDVSAERPAEDRRSIVSPVAEGVRCAPMGARAQTTLAVRRRE